MDGWLTIGTRLDNNKFDKQITQLEKQIKNQEEKAELKLKAKLQAESELERHKQKILEIEQEYERTSKQVERLQNIMNKKTEGISLTPQDFMDLTEYDNIVKQNEKLGATLDRAYEKQSQINNKVAQTSGAYNQMVSKVDDYKAKIEGVEIARQRAEVSKMQGAFDSVGSSVERAIGKVARLAIGIFGIRSAYSAVRQASSYLGTYDKQYAANIEYIKYSLTQVVAPILRYIVSLAATLLGYINAIVNAWFGINLFSNSSAKSFGKMKASAGGVAKSAKEIKNTLAGFDEMNVLSDTSTDTGGGGGGGGAAMPDFDLSKLQGEIPQWLQWIIDHKDEVIAGLIGIAVALLALEMGATALQALGIGLAVAGIVYAIEGLLKYLKDPSWANFGQIIQGIGIFIIGLGIAIGSVPAIVIGAVVLIVGTVIRYWEQIKTFLQNGIDWLTGKSDWVHQMFGDTIGNIYDTFVKNLQLILDYFDGTFKNIKQIFDGIITFIKGVFTGNWKQAWEGIKQIFTGIWNQIKLTFTTVFNFIKNTVVTVGQTVGDIISSVFKAVVNAVLSVIEKTLNTPINAINGMIDLINTLPGVSMGKIPTFNLPRLAVGGIINMPGRGIPVGGAIGGEAGAEGVIPLTDSQAMETLGEAIGRYITINANITNTMNGRVLSRQLQQIQNDRNFAYNS